MRIKFTLLKFMVFLLWQCVQRDSVSVRGRRGYSVNPLEVACKICLCIYVYFLRENFPAVKEVSNPRKGKMLWV